MSKQGSTKHKWTLMEWDGEAMWPYANIDLERIQERFKKGDQVLVMFKQARSLPKHRLYWSVVRQVMKNTELWATERGLHELLLTACGVTRSMITLDGDIRLIPDSIAFDNMEEDEFNRYFDQAMTIITTRIVPGSTVEDWINEAKAEARYKEAA